MTLTQQSAPYDHWDFVHPSSGDRLRIIPERGGLVSGRNTKKNTNHKT